MAKKSKSVRRVSTKRFSDGKNDPNKQFVKVFWFSLAAAALILAYLWFRGDNNVLGAKTICKGSKCEKVQTVIPSHGGNLDANTNNKGSKSTPDPIPTKRTGKIVPGSLTPKNITQTPLPVNTTSHFSKGLFTSFADNFKVTFGRF